MSLFSFLLNQFVVLLSILVIAEITVGAIIWNELNINLGVSERSPRLEQFMTNKYLVYAAIGIGFVQVKNY